MNGDVFEQCEAFFAAELGTDELPKGHYAHVWHLEDTHTDWVRTSDEAEASASRNGRRDVYFGVGLAPKGGHKERVRIETATGLLGVAGDIDIAGPMHAQVNLPPDEAAALSVLAALELG